MKRLKRDGVLFNVDGYIPEFDDIEIKRNNMKLFRDGRIVVDFKGVNNMHLYTILNEDGTEVPLLKQEDNKDSNLELLNNEMIQASVKFELQDLQQDKNFIEEKASITLEDINSRLKGLDNKDKQYNEDINCIKDSIQVMLDKFDSRFSELEKNIVSLNNSIYNFNNRLKVVEEAK